MTKHQHPRSAVLIARQTLEDAAHAEDYERRLIRAIDSHESIEQITLLTLRRAEALARIQVLSDLYEALTGRMLTARKQAEVAAFPIPEDLR